MKNLLFLLLACLPLLAQSDGVVPPPESDVDKVVASDREPENRALDGVRKPAQLLEFLKVAPGMRIADIGAGAGYTSELLSRAVGPDGKVFAQNHASWGEFVDKPLEQLLAKPANANIVRVTSDFGAILPEDARNLDLIVVILVYHDIVYMTQDRSVMNKALLDALKPGGSLIVIDHSAKEGTGTTACQTIHRIEQKVVVDELTAAGFKLNASADFLADPKDTKDTMAFGRPVQPQTDRFVLKFTK